MACAGDDVGCVVGEADIRRCCGCYISFAEEGLIILIIVEERERRRR